MSEQTFIKDSHYKEDRNFEKNISVNILDLKYDDRYISESSFTKDKIGQPDRPLIPHSNPAQFIGEASFGRFLKEEPAPGLQIDPQCYKDWESLYGAEVAQELVFAKLLGSSIATTLIYLAANRAVLRAESEFDALAARTEASFDRAKENLHAEIDAIVQV